MSTVHVVYPHGDRISCPDAIGRNTAAGLRAIGYEVRTYDWQDTEVIAPNTGDVLLGHPHPAPWTIFRRSARRRGWGRVLLMSPFNHDLRQVAFLEPVLRDCDLFLAITGNYWFSSISRSAVAHWAPKLIQVDLAVDPTDFPRIKVDFGERGSRKFLYIGHAGWTKNIGYLAEIAAEFEAEIAWIGSGPPVKGLRHLGPMDFSTVAARQLVSQYDFMVTVGSADANPATVLEAMAWGLIPVCTRESGYSDHPGILNVPLGNTRAAAEILRRCLWSSEDDLRTLQETNWRAIERHFNWARFVDQVVGAIESPASPQLNPITRRESIALALRSLTSPYSPLAPRNIGLALRGALAALRDLVSGGVDPLSWTP